MEDFSSYDCNYCFPDALQFWVKIVPLFPMNLEHIRTHYLQVQINKATLTSLTPKPEYNKFKEVQYSSLPMK